ncbi:MAG: glycosyltransferase, partial [Bdellovibrio sp.]|nr:glycosyltransferase [Bdellovibrio sp.]
GTMPNLLGHVKTIVKDHPPVACIPMGIDLDIEQDSLPLAESYRDSYLNKNYFNIVYAGTIGITNALNPFLEAAKEMQTHKDLRFVIIGDGALKFEYMQKYDLPNLVFAPKIPRNMVQSALESADLLYFSAHNSKVWDYGLSLNKVIDYMKAGKPIIASYTGHQSMINEAQCGEFVQACNTKALIDAIIKYKTMTKNEREEIGQRGKSWIYKNRDYAKLARDYSELISRLAPR